MIQHPPLPPPEYATVALPSTATVSFNPCQLVAISQSGEYFAVCSRLFLMSDSTEKM